MENVFTLNTAVIIELIRNIVIAILQKSGAFDDLAGLGIDIESYIDRLFFGGEEADPTTP